MNKTDLEELNDLLKDEIKNIKYARSKTAKFFICDGKLTTKNLKPSIDISIKERFEKNRLKND